MRVRTCQCRQLPGLKGSVAKKGLTGEREREREREREDEDEEEVRVRICQCRRLPGF